MLQTEKNLQLNLFELVFGFLVGRNLDPGGVGDICLLAAKRLVVATRERSHKKEAEADGRQGEVSQSSICYEDEALEGNSSVDGQVEKENCEHQIHYKTVEDEGG